MRSAKEKVFLTKVAQACLTTAKCHKAMKDGEEPDHEGAMNSLADLAEHCIEMCKATDDELEKRRNQPMPTRVSAILPADYPASAVRAVPRYGQRTFAVEPEVDEAFKGLVKVE